MVFTRCFTLNETRGGGAGRVRGGQPVARAHRRSRNRLPQSLRRAAPPAASRRPPGPFSPLANVRSDHSRKPGRRPPCPSAAFGKPGQVSAERVHANRALAAPQEARLLAARLPPVPCMPRCSDLRSVPRPRGFWTSSTATLPPELVL